MSKRNIAQASSNSPSCIPTKRMEAGTLKTISKRHDATCHVQQDQIRLDQAQNKTQDRIPYAATRPLTEVMTWAGSNLGGLTQEEVVASRTKNGRNVITHGKKKSLARRLADAFVNPFTAILFFLAAISAVTDMLFPALSLMGNTPEDFDPLTVVIIATMVVLSGTLRYIQEARSGNAAEKLLDMITTTATVSRKGAPREEIPLDEVVVGDIAHLRTAEDWLNLSPVIDLRAHVMVDCSLSNRMAGDTLESAKSHGYVPGNAMFYRTGHSSNGRAPTTRGFPATAPEIASTTPLRSPSSQP